MPTESPGPLTNHATSSLYPDKGVALFGGFNGTSLNSKVWRFDGNLDAWANLKSEQGPAAKGRHAIAYIPSMRSLVVFGGGSGFGITNETWQYDLSKQSWSNLTGSYSPPARLAHALSFESATDLVCRNNQTYDYPLS